MSIAAVLRDVLGGLNSPYSLAARARRRRADLFLHTFPGLGGMHAVDLGGDAGTWLRMSPRPSRVTLINLRPSPERLPDWMDEIAVDLCAPEATLGGPYDLVFSNSVIEHVGGAWRRARFAEVVRRLAPRHWIQTPYRYFPLEPHWLFPGFQFLPTRARMEISMRWPVGHVRSSRSNPAAALEDVLSVELLDRTELSALFPGSEILPERVLGMTKSLIAVRR